MILNALAMLICVGGAVMLVPAAYSLLKAPEEAWIFWAPGVVAWPWAPPSTTPRADDLATTFRGRACSSWWSHAGGSGARRYPAVRALGPHGSGGRLL